MDAVGKHILNEAEKLFMKFGMRSVTMDDIAKQLGMSKKTIYANFKDKDELVMSFVDMMLEHDSCSLEKCKYQSANAIDEVFKMMDFVKDMLSAMNPVMFYDLSKYHPIAYKKMKDFHETYIYNEVKAGLERGIKENLFRENINTEILAHARVAQVNWVFESNLVRSGKFSMYEVFSELTHNFLFGICTLSGQVLVSNYQINK